MGSRGSNLFSHVQDCVRIDRQHLRTVTGENVVLEVPVGRVWSLPEKDTGSEKEEKESSLVCVVYTVKFLFIVLLLHGFS